MSRSSSFACLWLLSCTGCSAATGVSTDAPTPPPAAATAAPQPAAAQPAPESEPAAAVAANAAPAAKLVADDPCAAICLRSTELKCKRASECEALCAESMIGTPCRAQLDAATSCMLAQPTSHWQCSEEGVAAIKEGFCDNEQSAFVACMSTPATP